ncbi:MAG: FliH/SctL family protein [Candidatus Cloacimonadota bacterium]|nr:FliH/SctL family protein [Candidatus Cloacimonadota bacterium]
MCSNLKNGKLNLKLKYPLQNAKIVPFEAVDKEKKIVPKFGKNYLDKQVAIELEKAKIEFEKKLQNEKKKAYESGFKAAEVKYKKEYSKKYQTSIDSFENISQSFDKQFDSILEDHEQDILQLTIDIAKKIILAELQSKPELILNILKKSMSLLSDKKQLKVFVNSSDWELVKENINDLGLHFENTNDIEIISSEKIHSGGCRIESNAGSINADIESQMNEIANQLLTHN